MPDHDELIKDAFRGLVSAAGPNVRPAGTAAVRTTVRHRRTMRALALGTLGVLVVAVPVTAYALTPHGGRSPLTELASIPTTASPTPSATASATQSVLTMAVTSVSGVVRNANTNAGLSGALVALLDSSGHRYQVIANSSGQFVFRSTAQNPITPGTLVIGAAMNGFQNQVLDNVDGQAGTAVSNIVLTLQPTPPYRGG